MSTQNQTTQIKNQTNGQQNPNKSIAALKGRYYDNSLHKR